MARNVSKQTLRKESPSLFLDLFYPFHYRVGSEVEHSLRGDLLTQHQTVILWIIHSEGDDSVAMRRKDVETRIGTWFDISSSAISKALRGLARAEQPLLEIKEDPQSGREKIVTLTDAGKAEVHQMKERAKQVIRTIVQDLTDEEIDTGLKFMRSVTRIVANIDR